MTAKKINHLRQQLLQNKEQWGTGKALMKINI